MRKPDLSAGASERARGGANVAHASIQALAPSARKRGELRAALMVRLVWSLHRREARHGGDDSQIMFETSLHFSDIFKKGVSLKKYSSYILKNRLHFDTYHLSELRIPHRTSRNLVIMHILPGTFPYILTNTSSRDIRVSSRYEHFL